MQDIYTLANTFDLQRVNITPNILQKSCTYQSVMIYGGVLFNVLVHGAIDHPWTYNIPDRMIKRSGQPFGGKNLRERPVVLTETIERKYMLSTISFPHAFPDVDFSLESLENDVRMQFRAEGNDNVPAASGRRSEQPVEF